MMSNVKRYWIKSNGGLLESETGNLVYYADYQSLVKELEIQANMIAYLEARLAYKEKE